MKQNKKEFNEALGVPSNITQTAQELFNDFKREFKKRINVNELEYEFQYKPRFPYRIADMDINEIIFHVNLNPSDQTNKVEVLSMSVPSSASIETTGKKPILLTVDKEGTSQLFINIAVPEDWSEGEVIHYFDSNRVKNISTFAHELKHEYDSFKKPAGSVKERAKYVGAKEMIGGLPPLRDFAFNLYYISDIESLVRPSEVAAELRTSEIPKKDFLEFIINNDTYKQLKEIHEFSVDEMKEELKKYADDIREIAIELEVDNAENLTDDELASFALHIGYITLIDKTSEKYFEYLFPNPFTMLFDPETDKKKDWFETYRKRALRFKDNPENFYKKAEKDFKIKGLKMMRKLVKLYDYIIENPSE